MDDQNILKELDKPNRSTMHFPSSHRGEFLNSYLNQVLSDEYKEIKEIQEKYGEEIITPRNKLAHRTKVENGDEENFKIYGKCSNPNWHGHNLAIIKTARNWK